MGLDVFGVYLFNGGIYINVNLLVFIMKRGLQHVEAIISFVLFIGFLVVALLFFNPLDTTRVLDSSLNYAFDEVSDNIAVRIESYSVVVDSAGFIPLSPKIGSEGIELGIIVQNESGELINETSYGYDSLNERIYFSEGGFYFVRFSEVYPQGSLDQGSAISEDDYDIASSNIERVWSEERVGELIGLYNSDYNALREDFNLPGRVGFSFRVVFSDGEVISPDSEIPSGLEVFSKRGRGKMVREDGSTEFVDLLVNVW